VGRTARAGAEGVAITFVDWAHVPRWGLINKALGLAFNEPPETYSTSDWIYTALDIPTDAKGVLPRAARTRAGLGAEEVEDLGETGRPRRTTGPSGPGSKGGGSSRGGSGNRGGGSRPGSHGAPAGEPAPDEPRKPRPRRNAPRKRTRSGEDISAANGTPAGTAADGHSRDSGEGEKVGAAGSPGSSGRSRRRRGGRGRGGGAGEGDASDSNGAGASATGTD